MTIYNKISDENRIKYGTEAERVLKIIINQYSDRTHFIYEILQNAEDAGATEIRFQLEKDRLYIYHNGRPFNEKDIQGVCGIADGTKEDGTRIGHFGIGFKSVYCYTEKPQIYSDQYHFVIKNQLFPEEIAGMDGLDAKTTCMILPFDKLEVSADIAYREIKDALIKKINAESILMLNQIKQVEIKVAGHLDTICINKEKYPLDKGQFASNVFGLSLNTTITNAVAEKERHIDADYLFFTDAEQEATTIIYNVDGKELKPVRNSKIYAFFPTAKEAHQNFYIHAPFDTTPARDNFKEGAEYGKHNIRLVKNIGNLIWFSLTWMRDHGYLSVTGLNTVFPIYEYEENDVLYGIYQNSIDMIQDEPILPTNHQGEYKRITEVCMPLWTNIADTFDDEDLRRLLHNREISWLAKEFSTEAFRDIRKFLNKNFDIDTLEWKDLVLNMDAFFLQQKSLSWTEQMMSRIESYCTKRITNDGHYINASRIPFVRTAQGEQVCAKGEDGHYQVYLNNPDSAKYRIDASFLRSDAIKSFYQRALGIIDYNIEQEAIETVLPKYETRQVKFKNPDYMRENINDLKIIKDAIYTNPAVLESVQERYILTDGTGWYKPTELYLKSTENRAGYSLVQGIIPIRYLSDEYLNGSLCSMRLDEEYFRKLGCSLGIRAIEVTKEEYLRTVHKYLGAKADTDLRYSIFTKSYISSKIAWGFNFEGFPAVFENMTKEKSIAIARFLNPHAMNFDIQGELVGAEDQHFSGKNVDSRMAYSMIGMQLCYEKWIYIEGESNPHMPSEVDKDDLLPEYKTAKRLISILPFKEVKTPLSEWLEANIADKGDIDLIKHYLSSPEQLAKVAKAMAKNEAADVARRNKRQSLKDVIAKGDKSQKESTGDDDLEIMPISEKGLKKRIENLDPELAKTLDYQTAVTKGLSFSSYRSNKEERLFLEQEYGGHCQICLKQIKKHDGTNYFEAINVLKFSELPEKLAHSSKYGWNSLCLCPNCAAEYNYCSKKISDIYEQVMSLDVEPGEEESIDIVIEIPLGKVRRIHYSPRHFIALKEAFKIFSEE